MIKFVLKGSIISFLTITIILWSIVWLPTLWGWHNYKIISYSMYPTLSPGNIILVKPVKLDDLKVGDIITFQPPGRAVVTHRVNKLETEGIITKGDANSKPDAELVDDQWIIGRVVLIIPLRGRKK